MVVDSANHTYWIKEDGTYETGLNTEDLTVTFRNIPLGSEDNLLTLVSKYINGTNCYISYNDVRQNMTKTLNGTKLLNEYKWVFPFFNQSSFTQDVSVAMNLNLEESAVVSDYDMTLLNSGYQVVQHIPFAILYKPVFPEPLTPPIVLSPIVD